MRQPGSARTLSRRASIHRIDAVGDTPKQCRERPWLNWFRRTLGNWEPKEAEEIGECLVGASFEHDSPPVSFRRLKSVVLQLAHSRSCLRRPLNPTSPLPVCTTHRDPGLVGHAIAHKHRVEIKAIRQVDNQRLTRVPDHDAQVERVDRMARATAGERHLLISYIETRERIL